MKSNLISKSQTASILKEISDAWKTPMPKIKNLRVHEIDSGDRIITGEGLMAVHTNNQYVPFLTQHDLLKKFPHVTVDMGAVKFMCNGANVMRPGIKSHSKFVKGNLVCIIEESQKKFLAVGQAMMDSIELKSIQKGEVVKNIHYISDKFWEIGKTIKL